MESIFLSIHGFFAKNRFLFWGILLGISLPLGYLASRISLQEDITKVLPGSTDSPEYQQVLKRSGMLEKLVVRVSLTDTTATDPDRLTAYAAAFVQSLESRKEVQPLIREIRHRMPDEVMLKTYSLFYHNLPFFLDEKDYLVLDSLITDSSIARSLQKNYLALMSPMSLVLKKQIQADPLHFTTRALIKLQSLQINPQFEVYDGYIVSKDRKSLLLLISPANPPSETGRNRILVEGLDQTMGTLAAGEYADVHAEYFGAAAVAVANARQVQQDIWLTVSLAVLSICLLLWLYFRKVTLPFVILLPIGFGVSFALALIYLAKGSISSIALGGGAVIIGIAVDYSLHVFTHYKHTRSLRTVIQDLSTPLLIGNISTVSAFLSLLFVKSEVLFDFGLFAGLSLIGAILFTLIFLPQFLAFYSVGAHREDSAWIEKVGETFAPYRKKYYRLAALGIALLSAFFLFTAGEVQFENDLNAMNFMTPELKTAEKHLRGSSKEAERSLYLLFKGKTLDEALTCNEAALGNIQSLVRKGDVRKYFGVTSLLVSDSTQRLRKARWQAYWTPEKKAGLKNTLTRLAPEYGFKATAFSDFFELLDKDFNTLPVNEIEAVKAYFLKDYISVAPDKSTVLMACVKIPAAQNGVVYKALSSEEGLFILDQQYIIKKFINVLAEDFNQIVYTSSLLVLLTLLLFYGRVELALIAFAPMLVSWLWILGVMHLFDLHFNIVNIIISTFIFGLGDDFTIFMMDGHLGEHKDGTKNLASYKMSILLSALTTLLGMGVLIFAQHPALKSIALISVVGIVCVLFVSYTVIPILFGTLISSRAKKGLAPITAISLISSLLAFAWFLLGCLILSVTGVILFKVLRFKGGQAKLFYHYLIMYFVRSLLYGVFTVKKEYRNPTGENLSKPAIIVANHQSFLDILVLLAAHPRLTLFTNDWVWKSPFFGSVVRMAGFFNVNDGVENSLDLVQESIALGYSIVIFPEGTRSADCGIKRFHKGAFFLAEQLGLDIVPVVLHGTGHCMPKNDFLLQPGTLTIQVLPRVVAHENTFGTTYQERTKRICGLLREEYSQLQAEIETPRYFYNRLLTRYLYKGPVLEWYCRVKVKLEKYYQPMHELVPRSGRIYDVGCGYGFLSYMLAFLSAERQVTGLDYDPEKTGLAAHCAGDTPNVSFCVSDALTYPYQAADAFLINDVLHYMPKAEQTALIDRCLSKLNPSGVLIIRDADASLQKRHLGTRLSELFSVKLLGFNKSATKQLHFVSSEEMLEMLRPYGVTVEIINRTKFNSNIIYYIKKTPVVSTEGPFRKAETTVISCTTLSHIS